MFDNDYLSADIVIRVPFYDVDVMRVVWHGHYLKYFEEARCVLLDSINYNYQIMEASGYAWPIVDCRIKYIKPATFNRNIKVTAKLMEFEHRMKIDYEIIDVETQEKLTKGYTVQVAVDVNSGEMLYVSPTVLLEKCHNIGVISKK